MAAAVAGARAPTTQRWGDVDDDADDAVILPPPTTSGPDSRGIKTTVEYKRNDKGEIVRVTSRVRVVKVEKKLYKVRGEKEGEKMSGRMKR
jgi:translation initiation factor 3 subunit G